jgi:hypothetical protein
MCVRDVYKKKGALNPDPFEKTDLLVLGAKNMCKANWHVRDPNSNFNLNETSLSPER